MRIKRICFISSDPEFLGGISLYIKNVIDYLKTKKGYDIFWVYNGVKDRVYKKNGVTFVELKCPGIYPLDQILFNFRVLRFLNKNYFDVINSHAVWGHWMNHYKKANKEQRIVHIYHGSTYYFYKSHLRRFGLLKKALISPILLFSYFIERPPWKNADKIICVSEHVKKEFEHLYGKRGNLSVIRTGVNLKQFRKVQKEIARKKINIPKDVLLGLYVGRGGWHRKGLDRAIKLSKEIYKKRKDYKLIVIGPDYHKVKRLIKEPFIKYLGIIKRDLLPYYYNASDIFFCFSRYEGGAPILTLSEAMATESLSICSEDSQQEIINKNNGVIINKFDGGDANKILEILNNKKERERIIKASLKTIRGLGVMEWAEKITNTLINKDEKQK
ncbi:hypothetical protein A3K62_01200 [Candidatus Pacearchaeota archaeon RBG_16_35_8]|nr:MAG: hypothetical protein A3K62_01200 [Candidatus Pacearchaeota archaeon RBG_16_35_8]